MEKFDIICIGSVLWDIIGRTNLDMPIGSDKPGKIMQTPGGVALNIAITMAGKGHAPTLLSATGCDSAGDMLLRDAEDLGIHTGYVLQCAHLPTDRYMAIEGPDGLIVAIADAFSLESVGSDILRPLRDGYLSDTQNPWQGIVVVDGNLTEEVLQDIASMPELAQSDLRVAPASPGKARRLLALRPHKRATYYMNRFEAELILDREFATSLDAANALVEHGMARAIVTDGPNFAADVTTARCYVEHPPKITPKRITGAGDTFTASHLSAEMNGLDDRATLVEALKAASIFVSGEDANV